MLKNFFKPKDWQKREQEVVDKARGYGLDKEIIGHHMSGSLFGGQCMFEYCYHNDLLLFMRVYPELRKVPLVCPECDNVVMNNQLTEEELYEIYFGGRNNE